VVQWLHSDPRFEFQAYITSKLLYLFPLYKFRELLMLLLLMWCFNVIFSN